MGDAFIAAIEEFEFYFNIRCKLLFGDKKETKLDPFLNSQVDAIIKAPCQPTELRILLMRIDKVNKLRSTIHCMQSSSPTKYHEYCHQLDGLSEALESDLVALVEQPEEQVSHCDTMFQRA